MSKSFDYIIVGGGSAGCTLAALLVRAKFDVLVLERGESQKRYPETTSANDWGLAFTTNALKTYCTTPQQGLKQNQTLLANGNVLGGGSSVNSMMYARPEHSFWQQFNSSYWKNERLEKLFDEMEQTLIPSYAPKTSLSQAFINAAIQNDFKLNEDFNKHGYEGVGYNLTSCYQLKRESAFSVFLEPLLSSSNLTVETEAQVTKILLNENNQAVTVNYLQNNKLQTASVRSSGEIIVCAGAIETPKILMLSGIGNKEHLESFSIPCKVNNSDIGKNLIDQPDCPVAYWLKADIDDSIYQIQACAFYQTSQASKPNIQILFFPGFYNTEMTLLGMRGMPSWLVRSALGRLLFRKLFKAIVTLFPPLKKFLRKAYIIMPCLMAPISRGEIKLSSINPLADPLIDPGYLKEESDKLALKEGLELAKKIGDAAAFDDFRKKIFMPADKTTLDNHLCQYTGTTYHYAGTCAIDKVVDEQLRVKGVSHLRIADSSIFPTLPVVTPNAACLITGYNLGKILCAKD